MDASRIFMYMYFLIGIFQIAFILYNDCEESPFIEFLRKTPANYQWYLAHIIFPAIFGFLSGPSSSIFGIFFRYLIINALIWNYQDICSLTVGSILGVTINNIASKQQMAISAFNTIVSTAVFGLGRVLS